MFNARLLSYYNVECGKIKKIRNRLIRLFTPNPQRVARRYTKMISRYDIDHSWLICNHGNWQGTLEYAPKWHYGEGAWATFEGLKVRIPENYDAYLTQKYGDWRADLPEEQKSGHHYYEIMDLERPYTHYIEKLSNGKN